MHKLTRMAVSAALISILGACVTEGGNRFDPDSAKPRAASFGAAASAGPSRAGGPSCRERGAGSGLLPRSRATG